MAKTKIEAYKPDEEDESAPKKDAVEPEKIGWYNMVTRFADCTDLMLLYLGLFGALGFGACMPAFCYYFGTMIDGVASVEAAGGMGDLKT